MSFRELAAASVIAAACAVLFMYAGRPLFRRFDVRRLKGLLVASLINGLVAGGVGALLQTTLPETFDFIWAPVSLGIVVGGAGAVVRTAQSRGSEKQEEEESK